ncbi:ACP S-malonyltransferase [Verrucomicrobiota bacterium]
MDNAALVFSGQGAQFVGMGKDLADAYPRCGDLFRQADEVLGYRLSELCFEGPEEELTRSDRCQPAIFVVSVACHAALLCEGAAEDFSGCAGLSLGEWSALHAAGALGFEQTLRVLAARGRYMQEACDEQDGAMVSVIGIPEEGLREICSAAGVWMANLNSAEQTVLSGPRKGIEEAEKMARDRGAKRTVILKVAGAFHSPLMASAGKRLAAFLEDVEFGRPRIPVVSNVTGLPHAGPDEIRQAMVGQVTSPVRWLDSVKWFMGNGVRTYVECGPGKVLSGLIRRIDREAVLHNIQDVSTLKSAVAAL